MRRLRPLRSVGLALGVVAAALSVGTVAAQQESMSRAFDLERRGNYAGAAEAYRKVLARRPGDLAAMLGLERALLPLNRSVEIIPDLRRALEANPRSGPLYGIGVRAWAAADEPDSIRAIAERWAQVEPGEEAPYREWGTALLGRRDRAGARNAYLTGRQRLGRDDALAGELAQLAVTEGDYTTALREWVAAMRRVPAYRASAVASLAGAPTGVRSQLLGELSRDTSSGARLLEAELRARWGDPVAGFRALEAALPSDRNRAAEALRSFLDQLRNDRTPAGKQAQGLALEALAKRSTPAQAARLRLEAAQAYSEAGDRAGARRMLDGLTADQTTPTAVASGAATTLVVVLIDEGKLDEADRRLAELRSTLTTEDYQRLRRRLVTGWVRRGSLDRAEAILANDSTVEGISLAGRLRLFRGDVKGAAERLRAAGPFAGTREEATQRTALLALLQPIESDSLPALGEAFLTLERADTTAAIQRFIKVAGELPPAQGGAELRLLAGRLARAQGRTDDAEKLFRAAAVPEAPATAPAAELSLAQLYLDTNRQAQAVETLEHLILTYPQSALVPQARRVLDMARGAVPET